MQLGVGKTIFPTWTAAGHLTASHGADAAQFALNAARADSNASRLDFAVRAMISSDHAVDSSRQLPINWIVPSVAKYQRGFAIARDAVTMLVQSGVIPGARERVGRQTLLAAKEYFVEGVAAARVDHSRFSTKLASGWLDATAEDAVAGVALLQPTDSMRRELIDGIGRMRAAVASRRTIDEALVANVTRLFDAAAATLDAQIVAAEALAAAAAPAA